MGIQLCVTSKGYFCSSLGLILKILSPSNNPTNSRWETAPLGTKTPLIPIRIGLSSWHWKIKLEVWKGMQHQLILPGMENCCNYFPTRLQRGEHWLYTSCIPTIMSWSSPGAAWDYPTCGVCDVPRGKTSWRHGEGTERSLQQNPNYLCKPHLFLTRGSKEQPRAIVQGSLRWGKKKEECITFTPWQKLKVEQWEAASTGRWGFAPVQMLCSFFFLVFYHWKVPEGKWQPRAPSFIVPRQRSFSLINHQKRKKSQNYLGYQMTGKGGSVSSSKDKPCMFAQTKGRLERNQGRWSWE